MSRIARKYYNSSFFHIIIQGLNKEYIFYEEINIQEYLKLLNKYKDELNVKILSYCIMNNHAHFLMFSENINNISNLMRKVNTIYAKYYNTKNNRVGYVFRDRFLSQPIDSEKYLIKCINYIHNNPVKANIVRNPEEYKYSTYKEFINGEKLDLLYELTGIKFNIEQFKEMNILEFFIDIDGNKEEIIENAIMEFCIENNIKVYEIIEKREYLKELVRKLKNNYKIKYTEMMEKLDIPRGVIQLLK